MTFVGRCLKKRCGFSAEAETEEQVEATLRDHVRAAHRVGARIEIERPLFTWRPETGLEGTDE